MTNETNTRKAPIKRFGTIESIETKPITKQGEESVMAKVVVDCKAFKQTASAFGEEMVADLEKAGVGGSVWFLGVLDSFTKDDGTEGKSMRIIQLRLGKRPTTEVEEAEAAEEQAPESAPVVSDDLTQVKGIGGGFAEKLVAAGIASFTALAEASDEVLDSVVKGAAKRAANGDWKGQAAELASVAA